MASLAVRRVVWHPLAVAGVIAGLATTAGLVGGPAFAWAAMGAGAGFATSGSV